MYPEGYLRVVKWSEVMCSVVKEGKSGRTVKSIYGWWSEVKFSVVKGTKPGRTVRGI